MTFEEITNELDMLSAFAGVKRSVIGYSVLGRPIYAFHVGKPSGKQIIITGAIHAREWITALLVAELIKEYSTKNLPGGMYFVPLCNPDGVRLALDAAKNQPLWKANARGVDLNVNFDADWGMGAQNVMTVGSENFIGPHPNSEPETQALVNFTSQIKPCAVVAYHSKGEVIYYGFEPSGKNIPIVQLARAAALAKKTANITGYSPVRTKNSTGGYCDWVFMHLGIPAVTIEVGKDEYNHPIGTDKLPEILAQNIQVPNILLEVSDCL